MEWVLQNMMEAVVEEKLEEVLGKFDCCKCEICKADMKCFALNKLPPKYVATRMGSMYARLENTAFQNEADVVTAVIKAIDLVSQHPRHEGR